MLLNNLVNQYLRKKGNKSEMKSVIKGELQLNTDITFKAFYNYLERKNILRINQKVMKKIKGDKFQKISELNINNCKDIDFEYNNILMFHNSQFLKLAENQKISYYLDEMNWTDFLINIEDKNIIIQYHIIVNQNN